MNVTCPSHLRGQRVIINSSRNPNTYSNTGIILCEVMIYGYKYVGMYLSCQDSCKPIICNWHVPSYFFSSWCKDTQTISDNDEKQYKQEQDIMQVYICASLSLYAFWTNEQALSTDKNVLILECPSGMYGPGCLTQCNCNDNCNVIDGDCITEKDTLGQETLSE